MALPWITTANKNWTNILVTHVGFPREIQEDWLLLLCFAKRKRERGLWEKKKTSIILCVCPPELHTITSTIPLQLRCRAHLANFDEKVHKPQSKSYGRICANIQLIFTHILWIWILLSVHHNLLGSEGLQGTHIDALNGVVMLFSLITQPCVL